MFRPGSLVRVARTLARSPGYLAAAVLTSALGIGALTAVLSLISKAVLEPLPWPNASKLVVIQETRGDRTISVSWLNFLDYRARTRTLDAIAAFTGTSVNLASDGNAERFVADMVTSNLFDVLGVRPLLGRGFTPAEDEAGSANVVVLGHAMWTARFGGDSSIVGRIIDLSGERFEVVGVMPPGFRFADGVVYGPADLWLPMNRLAARARENRNEHPGLVGIGRLRDGVAVEAARADIAGIARDLVREYPRTNADQGALIDDAESVVLGGVRRGLWLILGAVILLVLITCANVAGLSLARTVSRGRDLGIRLALGAEHRHLGQQLLTENVVVGLLGGAAGLALGAATLGWMRSYVSDLPRLANVSLDWRVFALIAAASLLASALSAIAPLLWARKIDAERWLRSRATDGGGTKTRRLFVTVQVAMSLVLLTVGGLLMRSFVALRGASGGIEPTSVLTFSISLPTVPYEDTARASTFFRQLEQRLHSVPGVEAVGAVSVLPFSGSGSQSGIARFEDPREPQYERSTDVMVVTPDYFKTVGIALLRGRTFTAADGSGSSPVAVVDERFAETFWPGEDPVGKRVQGWGFESLEIIGVVRHVTNYGVAVPSREELYVSHAARPLRIMNVVIKGQGNVAALTNPARAIVRELDAAVPIYRVRQMQEVVDATISNQRLLAFVSGAFATTALILTAIGLYALIAFQVALRTREIGVRMALGAQRRMVVTSIVRQAVGLVLAGAAAGVLAAIGAVAVIRNQLFGVGPGDPVVIGSVAVLLVLVAIAAAAIPARRAAGISPQIAMREE
jgi:putative ABC transport system permease protein